MIYAHLMVYFTSQCGDFHGLPPQSAPSCTVRTTPSVGIACNPQVYPENPAFLHAGAGAEARVPKRCGIPGCGCGIPAHISARHPCHGGCYQLGPGNEYMLL
jgi:hypothetical protein